MAESSSARLASCCLTASIVPAALASSCCSLCLVLDVGPDLGFLYGYLAFDLCLAGFDLGPLLHCAAQGVALGAQSLDLASLLFKVCVRHVQSLLFMLDGGDAGLDGGCAGCFRLQLVGDPRAYALPVA